eukprot:gene2938-3662_t
MSIFNFNKSKSMPPTGKDKLTIKEAYHAMLEYLEVLYQTNNDIEIGEFFGSMQINTKNGKTIDPSVWRAWLDAVKEVKPQIEIPEELQICCEFKYYKYSKEKVKEILEQVTSDPSNYVGKDDNTGSTYYVKSLKDGAQAWKIVQNGKTTHVGIDRLSRQKTEKTHWTIRMDRAAQLIAGVLITAYTGGLLGSGLISEGVSDLLAGIKAGITGAFD